jgi:phage shock protein PspC (stress-responsive transcriptional regulator)
MVRAARSVEDRSMTETPQQSLDDERHASSSPRQDAAREGWSPRGNGPLRRSVPDRRIAGVAGGLGRHLDIDPTILRVLFVVLCFFGGAGLLLYAALWVLVPEDGRENGAIAVRPATRNTLLIAAGVVALLLLLGHGWGGPGFPWPLLVVGGAVVAYLVVRDRDDRGSTGTPTAGPQDPATAPAPPSTPSSAATGSPDMAAPSDQQPPWAPVPPAAAPVPPPVPPRTRRGPLLFGFTLALVALALGGLGLYDAAGGAVVTSAYPALALAVVGAMLVVGSVLGRAGGLVLLGIVAALALAVTSAASAVGGFDAAAHQRDLSATPATAAAVHGSYYVPGGRVMLDLSDVRDPSALAGRTVDVGARAGELVVVLPRGVVTDVDAEISGPGQIDVPGRRTGGIGSTVSESLGSGTGALTLRAHLFAGHIDVRNP